MKKFVNLFLIIGLGFVIGIGSLFLTRLLITANQTDNEQMIIENQEITEKETTPKQDTEIKIKVKEFSKTEINNLFVDYPILKTLFIQEGVIREINLESNSYLEIFRNPSLTEIHFSPQGTKAIIRFRNNPEYFFLDPENDLLLSLPASVNNFVFLDDNNVLLYQNNNSAISSLILWNINNMITLKDLGVLNPEFTRLSKYQVLIYEKPISGLKTPVFLYDIRNPKIIKQVLPPKYNYSIIASKNGDYIFVNYQEGDKLLSDLYNSNFLKVASFSWGTIKEKCTFDDILVCAVPKNNISMQSWYQLESVSEDKIITFNPKTKELREIFDLNLDALQPYLTKMELFFIYRLNHKLFLIDTKNLLLE